MNIEDIFAGFSGGAEELIPVLQAVQKEFGYLSAENMAKTAEFLRIPPSRVFGVATFYSQFRFTPRGKNHCLLCRGTACHVKGAPKVRECLEELWQIKDGETTPDEKYSFETVACIGACGLAPTMVYNGKTHSRLTPKKLVEILEEESHD